MAKRRLIEYGEGRASMVIRSLERMRTPKPKTTLGEVPESVRETKEFQQWLARKLEK